MTQMQEKIDPKAIAAIARLQNAGYKTYIVGGAVRDFMLNREPKDYDVATSATPEEIKKVFSGVSRCMIIGRRFKLVHLYYKKDNIMEISTFRHAPDQSIQNRYKNTPERMILVDNEYGGTPEEDAFRRDFTVNALFYDPIQDEVLDYTGFGKDDVQNGIVRSIGEPALRFEEDPVRILRALKLAGQYGFRFEEKTEQAIRECMPLIRHASESRLSLEFEKILRSPHGYKIIASFRKYGFLRYFLPFLDRHYDTPAGQYALALWKRRDERIADGLYRDSISSILALYTLPFAEEHLGSEPGKLWSLSKTNDLGIFLRTLIRNIVFPHDIVRNVATNAMTNLFYQPHLRWRQTFPLDRRDAVKAYRNAREVAVIQNEVSWHLDDFEENFPPYLAKKSFDGKVKGDHRKRKKRRKKKTNIPADGVPRVKPETETDK